MLDGFLVLLGCQLIGEFAAAATGAPIPGPVIGMALLFGVLAVRGSVPASVEGVGRGLLSTLSLLFVPAGAGVMLHIGRLSEHWAAVAAALIVSTAAGLICTGLAMARLDTGRGE